MKMFLTFALLMSSVASYASFGSKSGDNKISYTNDWGGSMSSGVYANKKVLNAARPDAQAVLEGSEATPLFEQAVEILEEQSGVQFESNEEAAIAILEEK